MEKENVTWENVATISSSERTLTDTDERARKTIPAVSLEGRIIANRLALLAMDEIVTYQELTALIGRNVQGIARHTLYTAQRYLINESSMVFASIRNVGLKRLPDGEIATVGHQGLKHIRRTAKRSVAKLSCVQDFTSLTQQQKIRHNTALSLLAVFYEISKPTGLRRIEAKIGESYEKQLPVGETLNLFTPSAYTA